MDMKEDGPKKHMHVNNISSPRVAQRHSETEPMETRASDTLKVFFRPIVSFRTSRK